MLNNTTRNKSTKNIKDFVPSASVFFVNPLRFIYIIFTKALFIVFVWLKMIPLGKIALFQELLLFVTLSYYF